MAPRLALAPLSEQEKAEIAKSIEWSYYNDTIVAKIPIVKISTQNAVFKIVRVTTNGSENGHEFTSNNLAMNWSIDIDEIIKNF